MARSSLAPSERWLIVQALFSVTLAAWCLGGGANWAQNAIAWAVSLAVFPVWLAWHERRVAMMERLAVGQAALDAVGDSDASDSPAPTKGASDSAAGGGRALTANVGLRLLVAGRELKAFAPLMVFLGYVGLSLWNPSYVQVSGGGWFPREGWI